MKNKTYIIDIETSGLLEDMVDFSSLPYKLKPEAKLWCIAIRDSSTGNTVLLENEECTKERLQEELKDCWILVAHNGIKFDFPALKLFGLLDYEIGFPDDRYSKLFGEDVIIMDTVITSRLFKPDKLGGHSLDTLGEELGVRKIDWRSEAISLGLIDKNAPKGSEFLQYHPNMGKYCVQDVRVNEAVYKQHLKELNEYKNWGRAIRLESKLADLAVAREHFGFFFDKELADKNLEFLDAKMSELEEKVNRHLPPRPLLKGEQKDFTPPKTQLSAKGTPSRYMESFAERVGEILWEDSSENQWYIGVNKLPIPVEPYIKSITATIKDGDWVKMQLIEAGWEPTEWKERDLTKNAKKQTIPYEKRIKALDTWFEETMSGKYKKHRLAYLNLKEDEVYKDLSQRLRQNKPVKVLTSPAIRVGVEKDLCPNLLKMEGVEFAKHFADYATYKHRRSAIAGGEVDEDGEPTKGYLSMYREIDGRIPTPAIEIGANTNRMTHIGVANIPRTTSLFGSEMRALFGAGKGYDQLGYDFASLEARIEGHYVYPYEGGKEYSVTLIAEKPNDLHTINGKILGISRSDAKSFKYALTYGAQATKLIQMLGVTKAEAEALFNKFWDATPSLKQFKTEAEKQWISTGKQYVVGIDGRKINIRSQHSIVNAIFQSAGVISAKLTHVYLFQALKEKGYVINPFEGVPDVNPMICYHDEEQIAVREGLIPKYEFNIEEEAKEFLKTLEGQPSAITESNGKFIVSPENEITKEISNAIDKVVKVLELNVPLGFEWILGKNWKECH